MRNVVANYFLGKIIALFVIFGLLAIGFAIVQLWKQDNATVPPRILKKRSISFATWFVFCLGASFFVLIYYIPIWFQAIKGVSAVESGIRNLPMILGLVLISILSGIGTTVLGYYTPFMIICKYFLEILLASVSSHSCCGWRVFHQRLQSCPATVLRLVTFLTIAILMYVFMQRPY